MFENCLPRTAVKHPKPLEEFYELQVPGLIHTQAFCSVLQVSAENERAVLFR